MLNLFVENFNNLATEFQALKGIFAWYIYTVKPALRGHLQDKEKVALWDRWPLNRGSVHMKFSMTGQEKGDFLIQVTA